MLVCQFVKVSILNAVESLGCVQFPDCPKRIAGFPLLETRKVNNAHLFSFYLHIQSAILYYFNHDLRIYPTNRQVFSCHDYDANRLKTPCF